MNITKQLQLCLLVLGLQYGAIAHCHPVNAVVEAYFLPRDQKVMSESLDKLLNNTRKQLLMAMYWITDENIINHLITLKNNGVDVQVIFDESSKDGLQLIDRFEQNGITPFVHASSNSHGLMHNKFLVVDNKTVWTGSANFSKTVLDSTSIFNNDENILVARSQKLAQQYSENFHTIKKNISNSYISLLVNCISQKLPNWLEVLPQKLYQTDYEFFQTLHKRFMTSEAADQTRFFTLFPTIGQLNPPNKYIVAAVPETRWQPATKSQQKFLKNVGIPTDGISNKKAKKMIRKINRLRNAKPYYAAHLKIRN